MCLCVSESENGECVTHNSARGCMCCVCAVYVLCMCCVCAVPVYVLCMCRACVCAVPVYVLCLFMCCACVYAAPCICCACTRTHRHRDARARARALSLSLTLARAHTRHKLGTKLVRCTTKTKTVVHRKRKLLTLTCIFASIAYRDARAVRAHYRILSKRTHSIVREHIL